MLLEGIETLLVLNKEKTMSRTGSQLYISQSAVSKRIANLEKKLDKKLVEPDGRLIRLTPAAEALIRNVGPTFIELQGLISDEQTLSSDAIIKMDCSETLLSGYLSTQIEYFRAVDRALSITTNHTPRIVENVQSGRATLGLCAGYLPKRHGLKTFHLFDEPFFVVSGNHLTELPTGLICNDLTNPANTYQLEFLSVLGVSPLMEMDSYTAAARLALGGLAPALIPQSIIKTLNIASQHIFEFKELQSLVRPVHLCVRAKSLKNERVKTLIETIADAVPRAASEPSSLT
ncbi:LysR family transcriptional regulator [Vibrio breoganii]|uniref:LysR family transcriptional regulator n=1 Tax=Vibrio breoganii TaxID=553239 RepID=UPI000C84CB1D|nr:LysR family transcriptional regulator [Vibrio breoganii]MDN3716319.1 LysR family transcriptional regulator [Vibrio breoganii]PMG03410.1 transcriptional regulator [Vibrio breoganii]PMG08150.1 transcriptional regulator [Vibrio breoganii]PMG37419.1 transcriptional regulator [Vibrio breoganii]PMG91032.1 transcriptional regulator [Vibrio breoganii]